MAMFENEGSNFSRRLVLLGGMQTALFLVLAGRLQYLQIARSDTYSTLAEANRVNITELKATRGRIVDRHGKLLAGNDRNLSVELVPEQANDLKQTLRDLQDILGLSEARMRDIRRRIKRSPRFKPVQIAEDLSWEKFAALNLQLPFLPGVKPVEGEKRVYPEAEAAAHILGYVGSKTREDLQRIGNIVGETVGRSGVERDFEESLRGEPGVQQLEVNARGRTVRELQTKPGQAGEDLVLALDLDLQKYAGERLDGHSGSALVMDVETGEMLTMASAPAFDPNDFSRGIEKRRWERLLDHDRKPLMNKALRGLYSPGSTFKMLVALAGLEAKLITPDDKITCTGVFSYAGEEFHCWLRGGHGPADVIDALEKSCDTYFYDLALKVGIDRIEAMARRFGFGEPTGINLFGEKSGTVPGRDWKRANFDAGWRHGETVITGIGQGYMLTTPLQMLVMTAALANGGRLVTPSLVKQTAEQAVSEDLQLDPQHVAVLQAGLYRAVNKPDGTAYASSLLIDGQRMSGKTGTVQVRRISKEERKTGIIPNSKLDWHLRDHSLFVGYLPHDKPRYAVTVVIEHGGGGAQVAAPIARDIMLFLLRNRQPVTSAVAAVPGDAS